MIAGCKDETNELTVGGERAPQRGLPLPLASVLIDQIWTLPSPSPPLVSTSSQRSRTRTPASAYLIRTSYLLIYILPPNFRFTLSRP